MMNPYSFYSFLVLIFAASSSYGNDEIWEQLNAGGKVALIRHAQVEEGEIKGNSLSRDPSCENEKNLSNEGRNNSLILGKRFKDRQIPISKVFHSPFCRTTETARLAFKDVSPQEYLSLIEILTPEKATLQTEMLNNIIGSYDGDGNLILITHEPNIMTVSFETVKHLDIVVFKPMGGDAFEEIGLIRFSN